MLNNENTVEKLLENLKTEDCIQIALNQTESEKGIRGVFEMLAVFQNNFHSNSESF